VEDLVLPEIVDLTLGELSALLKDAVIKVDPDGADARHKERRKEREVIAIPQEDGMSDLYVTGAADHVTTAYNHVNHLAREMKNMPGETRTLPQLCSDISLDLLAGKGTTSEVVTVVQVMIPATMLLNLPTEQNAYLHGYGPIPPALAKQMAADATWRRLITDPLSGTLLDLGRSSYRPSSALRDHVHTRDMTCRAPGCRLPAVRCDIDHVCAWCQGGNTDECNLCCLCKHHHRLKDEPGFSYTRHPDTGQTTWTTPTGKTYTKDLPRLLEPDPDPPPF
jgi:hypothetical protein